jgi:hypothetical protein
LTLLRDPVVITLYLYAFVNGLVLRKGVAQLWLGFAAITTLFGLVQYLLNNYGLVGWLLGVRSYWLYTPLAFVVAAAFRRRDVLFFLKLNLWLAIPYAFLVASQYNAGAFAFINRGVAGNESAAIGLASGIIRPFGLFTYTGPNVDFTAAIMAVVMATFLAGPRARPVWPVFLLMAAAAVVMSLLTGSRSIFFLVGIIVMFSAAGSIAAKPSGRNLVRIPLAIGLLAIGSVTLATYFPDMLSAMTVRFDQAERAEGSIWLRAFGGLLSWVDPVVTAPYEGYGIGLGAAGVSNYLGVPALIYGESDLQRNVNELGLFLGLAMLLLRFGTAVWIALLAFRQAKKGDPISLPLAGYAAPAFLVGQITFSPILAFLPWLFCGLVIASLNSANQESAHARTPA